jgi:hypothetical protein
MAAGAVVRIVPSTLVVLISPVNPAPMFAQPPVDLQSPSGGVVTGCKRREVWSGKRGWGLSRERQLSAEGIALSGYSSSSHGEHASSRSGLVCVHGRPIPSTPDTKR